MSIPISQFIPLGCSSFDLPRTSSPFFLSQEPDFHLGNSPSPIQCGVDETVSHDSSPRRRIGSQWAVIQAGPVQLFARNLNLEQSNTSMESRWG